MFLLLLLVTFSLASMACWVVTRVFERPIGAILGRVVSEEVAHGWQRYLTFALYVVGISGGVRIWELEKYVTPLIGGETPVALDANRWILEVYRTIISTLQSIAWLLLAFFAAGLIAYVIVRGFELRHQGAAGKE